MGGFIFCVSCSVQQASVPTAPPKVDKLFEKSISHNGEFMVTEKPSIFLWPVDRNGVPLNHHEQIQARADIIKLSDQWDDLYAKKTQYDDWCSNSAPQCTEDVLNEAIGMADQLDALTEAIAKQVDETYPVEKNFLTSSVDDIFRIAISNNKVEEIRLVGFQKTTSLTMFTDKREDSRFKIYDIVYNPEKKSIQFKLPWLNVPPREKNEKDEFKLTDEEYLQSITVLGTYKFDLELTLLKSGLKRYAGEIAQIDKLGNERIGRATLDGKISATR